MVPGHPKKPKDGFNHTKYVLSMINLMLQTGPLLPESIAVSSWLPVMICYDSVSLPQYSESKKEIHGDRANITPTRVQSSEVLSR